MLAQDHAFVASSGSGIAKWRALPATVIAAVGATLEAVIFAASPYRAIPPTTTSITSLSVAATTCDHTDPPPPGRSTVTSPKPPWTSRPADRPQQRASTSPGLQVTISTRSESVSPYPSFLLASLATFSSPSTCLVPDGPQSQPRQTLIP